MSKALLRPHLPTNRKGWIVSGLVAAGIIGTGAFAVVYLVLFPTSAPPPLRLSAGASQVAPTLPSGSGGGAPSQYAGRWTIAQGSIAGYRVREKLAFLPARSDAVGRTSSISGSATVTSSGSDLTISQADFTVDVTTLTSDRSMRDDRIHTIGLESDRYPTASFALTKPATIPPNALTGQQVHTEIAGQLTIHGTGQTETIPIDAHLSGGEVEAVGSLTFPWSAFNMQAPNVGNFVTVDDHATMEFDLRFARG